MHEHYTEPMRRRATSTVQYRTFAADGMRAYQDLSAVPLPKVYGHLATLLDDESQLKPQRYFEQHRWSRQICYNVKFIKGF